MTTHSIGELLATHPFFAGLGADDVALLAGCGRNVQFDAGEKIFREGEPADQFYVIRHGLVAIEIMSPTAGAVVLETLRDGDVLGWSWLFPPYRWTFDARALEATRATELDGACLRGKCEHDPRLGYDLMRRFAGIVLDRLQAARVRLLDLYGDGRGAG